MKKIKRFDKAKFNFTDQELVSDILDLKLLDVNYSDEELEGDIKNDELDSIQGEGSE